jgi:uncharacterized membrane protein
MSEVATIPKRRRQPPSRQARAVLAAITGGLMGAVGGAIIGASVSPSNGALIGAVLGAMMLAISEGVTDALRQPGQTKPLAQRIFSGAFFGAVFGTLLTQVFGPIAPLALGLIVGALSGLFSFAVKRMALGIVVGLLGGLVASAIPGGAHPAVLGGAVVLVYRVMSAALFRGVPLEVMGERVPKSQVRYVVPFEANSQYVGADYFRDLARARGGGFKRNAPGIGIVESMGVLRGPRFDPDKVDPLIREFYEHTSRFKLSIVPVWRRRMLPLYWLFKRYLAQPIGQANLPFDVAEAQRGIVSYIDTIDFEGDDLIDVRGWVRVFEESGEAIYVGVYTTFRHEDIGYVSVGFPLPASNFTATLLPHNHDGGGFLLKSHGTRLPFPGHYVSVIEGDELTVFKLPTFGEEIEVYVRNGRLRTDHRFYLSGLDFLTLYYTIERTG